MIFPLKSAGDPEPPRVSPQGETILECPQL